MDYDVDAVSIDTYDINSSGLLRLWSPYADLSSVLAMEASMKLPFPTGIEVGIEVNTNKAEKFFSKYRDLFKIKVSKNGEVYVNFKTQDVALVEQFLRESSIPISSSYKDTLRILGECGITILMEVGLTEDKLVLGIIEGIRRISNKHNLFFNSSKTSKSVISLAVNNFSLYSMYSISANPVNLIESLTSVDGTTGALKEVTLNSEETLDLKLRTPGNWLNKIYSLYENQVGKKGVGICAIGLKGFFGLTQYYNTLLKEGKSEHILLGPNGKGITIGGKTYYTLANLYTVDPNNITNLTVLDALAQAKNDEDAAITLSAFLSLATDNAKELALSKLNAAPATIGMYLYGISIGMNFKDIATILMSDTAKVLTLVLNSNTFIDSNLSSRLSSVFDYFDFGPTRQLLEFSKVVATFLGAFLKDNPNKTNRKDADVLPLLLSNFAITTSYSLDYKLKQLEKYRGLYKGQNMILWNQLIDFIEDYVILGSKIGRNYQTYKDILTLYSGAEEFRVLGQMLSLNLGLKTAEEELFTQLDNFEMCIYNRVKDLRKGFARKHRPRTNPYKLTSNDQINFINFINNEDYLLRCILRYEEVKHSFNILEAITKVAHSKGYAKSLACGINQLNRSYKFRSVRNLFRLYTTSLKYMDSYKVAKGILRYIGNKTIKEWMRYQEIKVLIPRGNKYFDKYGNIHTFEEDTEIQLGNDWNNATFRMFIEKEIIPNLKKGIYKSGSDRRIGTLSSNKFILDLSNDITTITVLGNSSIIYTLPINMLPRTDTERNLLSLYKAEFNKLSQYAYVIGNTKLPLVEAFTYYAMIANEWRLGEKSLVPILEDFLNTGIIKSFHDFETALDRSDRILTNQLIDLNEILPYIVLSDSPYSSSSEYIKYRNPVTRKRMIMKIQEKESSPAISEEAELLGDMQDDIIYEAEYEDEYGINKDRSKSIGKYDFRSQVENTNYFPSGYIENSESRRVEGKYVDLNGERAAYTIDYDSNTETITSPERLKGMKMPFKKVDGLKVPDSKLLESIIRNLENPC